MPSVGGRHALHTWLRVHLAGLAAAQALVLALGLSSTDSAAEAAVLTREPITTTAAPSGPTTSTASTTVAATTTVAVTTPVAVTTTTVSPTAISAATATTAAPPTTAPAPAPVPASPPAMAAATADEQELLADHNSHRASLGVAPLQPNACLTDAARRWAAEQAARRGISHQPDLGGVVGACMSWTAAGENVGYARSASELAALWWNSNVHRANISSPSYSTVGIGVVIDSSGTRWACVVFAG